MNAYQKQQYGLSLIEVMVAMVIALVALLAAAQMHQTSREAGRIQTMQNRLSEDGRFALSMLQRVISQAGYRTPGGTNITDDIGECTPGRTQGCRIIKPVSTSSVTVRFVGDNANLIGCDGSKVTTTNATTTLTISSGSNKLQCQPSGGTAVDWIATSGAGTSLVDFKLSYGLDNGPETIAAIGCGAASATDSTKTVRDCVADTYADLTNAVAKPDQVVSVRVCLVLRTDASDAALAGSTYSNCDGGSSNAADNRLYRTFRSTILLRNR